jgi:Tfp pilus assembly protein PilF
MLTGKQKKFIKKNIKKLSLEEIAGKIGISPKEIENYLKNIWRKDKFTKFHKRKNQTSNQPINPQHGWFKSNWYIILGLIVLVFAIYANALSADFVSDDVNWILKNPNVGNFANLLKLPDRPIIWLIFAIAHAIGGVSPIFYRLPNVLIHAGSAVAIFILLNTLINRKTAIFTSLIFAVHPILIESVTWIAGGSQAGLGFTFLISFITYILSYDNKKLYIVSIFFYVMSLLFSEKAVSLIFIFPLYEIAFGSIKNNWKRTLPYLLVGAITIVILFTKVGGRVSGLQTYNYVQPGFDNPLIKIPMAITEYLRLMFWPSDLSLYRPDASITWFQYFIRLTIFLSVLIVAGISYWKPIFGKFSKHIFFWPFFFVITLLPTLTPFRFASTVAERYVYLGSLGIFTVVGIIFTDLSDRRKLKIWIYTIFAIMIVALSLRTVIRNRDWLNEDNLWIASAKVAPNNPNVLLNLGDMYTRHKEYQKATDALTKAIQIKPNYADAYHNLANVEVLLFAEDKKEERLSKATENYLSAIKYNPVLWQSYQSLAYIYYDLKIYDKAIEYLNGAIKINPTNITLQYNLGLIYLNLDEKEKAKETFSQILKADPGNTDATNALQQIMKSP